eukprot:scaffold293607_cov17-Prasinocladus_malaysianus.AAC.1
MSAAGISGRIKLTTRRTKEVKSPEGEHACHKQHCQDAQASCGQAVLLEYLGMHRPVHLGEFEATGWAAN